MFVNPRLRIVLFVVPGIIVAAVATQALHSRQPSAQGQPLDTWLEDYDDDTLELGTTAADAVREMGTNALPALLELIRSRDGRLKVALLDFLERHAAIRIALNPASYRQERAIGGFHALGPVAAPAIPELIALLGEPYASDAAARALNALGPDTVPPLARAVTDADPAVRARAAQILGWLGPEARAAVPALVAALQHDDAGVRALAADALRHIAPDIVEDVPEK